MDPATQPSEHARVRAAESRYEFIAAGSFTVLLAGTLAYVHSLFAPITPPERLWTWTIFTGGVIAIMAIVPTIVVLRKPDDTEVFRVWAPVGKVVAVLYDLAVASSVWLLLPFASEPLRLLMVIFYAAAVSGQVASTAESLGTVVFGVMAILGSAALFFWNSEGPYSTGLAVFLLAFGLLMIFVAVTIKVAVRSAIKARMMAEDASVQLREALVSAEAEHAGRLRFMAAASHDLRQPLQAASLFFQQVRAAVDAPEPAIRGVGLALNEADGLLGQLSDQLRLDAGKVRAEVRALSAGGLLAAAANEAAPLAASEGIAIRLVSTELQIEADPILAGRCLRNFVQNAVRHSGGRRILLGARRRGDRVRLYVLDDGRGVSPEDREGLFQEYVQGAQRTSRGGLAGLGLGLSSAARLAALMGGQAGFEPRAGGGSAFFLETPRAGSPI